MSVLLAKTLMDQRRFKDFVWSNSQSVLIDISLFAKIKTEVIGTEGDFTATTATSALSSSSAAAPTTTGVASTTATSCCSFATLRFGCELLRFLRWPINGFAFISLGLHHHSTPGILRSRSFFLLLLLGWFCSLGSLGLRLLALSLVLLWCLLATSSLLLLRWRFLFFLCKLILLRFSGLWSLILLVLLRLLLLGLLATLGCLLRIIAALILLAVVVFRLTATLLILLHL